MNKCYITKRNSEYTVIQNPIKSNVYSDGMLFPDFEKDRDTFLNNFLGVTDWRNEVSNSRDTFLKWTDETHFTFTLDLTTGLKWANTPNGKLYSRRDALACDFLIMEDDNEDENSPNRFTFWNIQCQFGQGKNNYTNLTYSAEKDIPFTYGVQNWFKDGMANKPVLVNLERGISTNPIQYGNENMYEEEFNFDLTSYREKEIIPITSSENKGLYNNGYLISFSTPVSWQTKNTANPSWPSIASQLYYTVKIGKDGSSTKVSRYDIMVSNSGTSDYPVQDDITYFLYFPSKHYSAPWIAFSRLIKSSEYVIGINAIPFNEGDYTANVLATDDNKMKAYVSKPSDGTDGTSEDPIEFEGSLYYLATQKLSTIILPAIFKTSVNNIIGKPLKINTSKFNKYVLNYSDLSVELKPEMLDNANYDNGQFFLNLRNTPQSLSMDLHLPYIAYKGKNVFGMKGLAWDVNNSIPRVVAGDQSTLQNQNQINLQNNINQRDKKFAYAGAAVGMAASLAENAARPFVGHGLVKNPSAANMVAGGEAVQGGGNFANNVVSNAHKIAAAKDKIHMQAAQMSDSYNNVGQYNDGTITGMRASTFDQSDTFDVNNTMNLTHYQLVEPLYTMCKNFLYQFGSNLGNDLYDIKQYLTHLNGNKFTFVKASDYANCYQSLKESYSPHEKTIMTATLMDGWRGWIWTSENNPFTYIGDLTLPNDWKTA